MIEIIIIVEVIVIILSAFIPVKTDYRRVYRLKWLIANYVANIKLLLIGYFKTLTRFSENGIKTLILLAVDATLSGATNMSLNR